MQKIKIMALIIMILISGLAKSSSRELSPEEKAYLDIEVLSQAVELYHSEFGSFPTNEQGLDLLSQEVFVSKNFPFFKCASVKVGSGTVGLHWFLSSVLFTSASRSL